MKIIIDGCPISQARMKFCSINGMARAYDPRKKEKDKLKDYFAKEFGSSTCFNFPRISFIFHMPIPQSTPKKLLPLYNSGMLKHTKKPDVDNFCKLYLDCQDGVYFHGDQKVSLGNCVKLYHPHPKTIIFISEMTEVLSPLEVDPATWLFLTALESGKQSSFEMASLPDFYSPTTLSSCKSLDKSNHFHASAALEQLLAAHDVTELKCHAFE